jgi:hypothetical protein
MRAKLPAHMTTSAALARRTLLALRATLLLAALLLGATFHFLHHLQDPACGSGSERTGHVCVACSGLHGSTLVAGETQAPEPGVEPFTQDAPRTFANAVLAPRGQAAPRAPPAS